MLRKSKLPSSVIPIILIVSLVSLSSFVQATPASFYVNPGEELSRSTELSVNDRVLIEFSVVWGAEAKTVDFSMVSPNGTITDFGEQGTLSYSFVCTEKGQYTLHFINHDPAERILITLECKVQSYVLGMPTNLFWLLLIAAACIAGIIAFTALSKTS